MTRTLTDAERIAMIRAARNAASDGWRDIVQLWSIEADLDWLLSNAEARAAVLAEVRAKVDALAPTDGCFCEVDRDVAHDEPDGGGAIYVRRAAVLALLSEADSADGGGGGR